MQGVEHGTTRHMVEGPNGVNRENRCSGARFGGCTEQSANRLSAAGAQTVLVGHTGCLKVRREVLRQDPPNKSPQHVADYKRPRAAIRLAQGYKASSPRRPSSTTGGTVALASRLAAPYSKRASSSSSKRMRRCSLVAPDGPATEPRRALLIFQGRGTVGGVGSAAWHQQGARRARAVAAPGREVRQVYRRCRAQEAQR